DAAFQRAMRSRQFKVATPSEEHMMVPLEGLTRKQAIEEANKLVNTPGLRDADFRKQIDAKRDRLEERETGIERSETGTDPTGKVEVPVRAEEPVTLTPRQGPEIETVVQRTYNKLPPIRRSASQTVRRALGLKEDASHRTVQWSPDIWDRIQRQAEADGLFDTELGKKDLDKIVEYLEAKFYA